MSRAVARSLALIVALQTAPPVVPRLAAQGRVTAPVPADTFRDDGARDLVLNAMALRDRATEGLASYEADATERMRVGLEVGGRLPLRSRTLYHREQAARVYWQRSGTNTVRWKGRREGAPTLGDDWDTNAPFGLDFDIVEELGLDDIGIDLIFDPLGDRLDLFDAGFIQPVSAAGLRLYRFASGDTIRIRLPAPDRTITLVEVVVEPRETAWEAVEGSLWFDRDTGVLVRAAYRPSGVWDEAVREPHDLDDVPGFLKPAIGTVTTIVIEYGLYEQRWWLPRRVLGEGVFDWGHGLIRMPLTMEWTLTNHVVNEAPDSAVTDPGLVVAARRRIGDDYSVRRIDYLREPGEDLTASPDLPAPLGGGEPLAFSREELTPLVRRIERVAGPPPGPPAPGFGRALLASLRYDRVMGLSVGYRRTLRAGRFAFAPSVRLATAIPDLFAGLNLSGGPVTLSAYHRIDDASDWHVDGLGSSAATLLFGLDGGDYFRSDGASLGWHAGNDVARVEVSGFAESQRPIARRSSFALATLAGGTLRPNLAADRVDLAGVRLRLSGQIGTDIQTAVVNWRLHAEAADGGTRYGRGSAELRVAGALPGRLAGALEVETGLAGPGAPIQREFLLGGVGSLRGVRENALDGPAFWRARVEAARGLPGLRAAVFADAGWAGARDGFTRGRPTVGVGAGVSLLDGVFRFDIARGVLRSATWRAYVYLDGVL